MEHKMGHIRLTFKCLIQDVFSVTGISLVHKHGSTNLSVHCRVQCDSTSLAFMFLTLYYKAEFFISGIYACRLWVSNQTGSTITICDSPTFWTKLAQQ